MGFANGKLVRVTLRAVAGSDQQVNTFHYDLQDATLDTPNDPQSLADFFRDNVLAGFKAFYSSAWTIDPVLVVEEIDPLNPHATRGSWTSGSAGAGTATPSSDLLPPQCNVLVALKTASLGRRFNGRMWLGGSRSEGEQVNGSWSSSFLTGCATYLATIPHQPDIASGISASVADWVVYSRTQRAANQNPYAVKITSATARTLVHTLRTRALY